VTADRGYREAAVDADLEAIGVKTVAIPRRGKPGAARQQVQAGREFRKLVKWRTGSEGRISCLKRWGWDRTISGLIAAKNLSIIPAVAPRSQPSRPPSSGPPTGRPPAAPPDPRPFGSPARPTGRNGHRGEPEEAKRAGDRHTQAYTGRSANPTSRLVDRLLREEVTDTRWTMTRPANWWAPTPYGGGRRPSRRP
jgi:hypothetical protein